MCVYKGLITRAKCLFFRDVTSLTTQAGNVPMGGGGMRSNVDGTERSKVGTCNSRNGPTLFECYHRRRRMCCKRLPRTNTILDKRCVNTISRISFSSIFFSLSSDSWERSFFRPNSNSLPHGSFDLFCNYEMRLHQFTNWNRRLDADTPWLLFNIQKLTVSNAQRLSLSLSLSNSTFEFFSRPTG